MSTRTAISRRLLLAAILSPTIPLCASARPSRKPTGSRTSAPDFRLPDARGRICRLSDFRGTVVVLNFWATWCAPCRQEIRFLNRVHRTYSPRGLTVLGIAMDQRGWAVVTPFLIQHNVDYPVLLGNPKVGRLYGGLPALPRTFFLDRALQIVASHEGMLPESHLQKIVETMLAESPAKDGEAAHRNPR